MRRNPIVKASVLIDAIASFVPESKKRTVIEPHGVARRCAPKVKSIGIVHGLTHHTVVEEGTLAKHTKQLADCVDYSVNAIIPMLINRVVPRVES